MESMLSMCLHPSRLASLVPVYVQKKVKEWLISQSLLTMQPKIPYSENRHLPHTKCSLTFPFSSTLLKLKPPLSIPVCIPPPFFFCSHSHYTLVHLRIHPFSFPLTNEQNVIKHGYSLHHLCLLTYKCLANTYYYYYYYLKGFEGRKNCQRKCLKSNMRQWTYHAILFWWPVEILLSRIWPTLLQTCCYMILSFHGQPYGWGSLKDFLGFCPHKIWTPAWKRLLLFFIPHLHVKYLANCSVVIGCHVRSLNMLDFSLGLKKND